ncbi:hypothetical protein ACFQL4_27310 [Halosimplex aquaticum]
MLGVHTALGAAAGGVGGLLGGWAASFGYAVAFGVAGGLVLLGAGLVFSLRALSGGTHAVEPAADTPLDHAGTETGATPSAVAADDGDQTD